MAALRVGVTGHRWYDDADTVRAEIAEVAATLVERAGGTDVEVWSSLAEGADRVVADELLRLGATLIVVLPLPAADYRTDFGSPASVADFDRLVDLATDVRVADVEEDLREAAYEAAGLAILDAVDVIVAVWDGEPSRGRGGTAELIDAAERRGREVIVVPVRRGSVER